MSNPEKDVDLMAAWAEHGVKLEVPPVLPRSTKSGLKKKRKGKEKEGNNTLVPGGKDLVDLEGDSQGASKKPCMVEAGATTNPSSGIIHASAGPVPSPAAHTPSPRKADTSDPDGELQKQKEKLKEKMREKGMIPSIADLEACQRVGQYGLGFFEELAGELAGVLSKRLEEVPRQWIALAKLQGIEKDRHAALKRASDAATREAELKTRVADLTLRNNELSKQIATASVKGFQSCLNLAYILAPDIEFKYLDGSCVAREGKIYRGEEVVFDPAEHRPDGEEEETESPEANDADAAGNAGDA